MFFRPLGSLYFWLFYKWAHLNSVLWHIGGLLIHLGNTMLVFRISGLLSKKKLPALVAAILFGWHGSHVETVCWMTDIFDLLATFFAMLCLLLILRNRSGALSNFAVVAAAALACLSKESAFCLPLLVVCSGLFRHAQERRRVLKQTVPVALSCAAVFLYRLWYLQGVGGYRNPSGQSIAAGIHPISLLQAFSLRIWALLFFPANWSERLGLLPALAAAIMLLCLCIAATSRHWTRQPKLYPAVLFVLCGCLPVFPLLMIGSDLSGARVLYLPSVGASLLFMRLIEKCKVQSLGIMLGASLALFQLAMLQHNQQIWTQVAITARQACSDAAAILKQDDASSLEAFNLPRTKDGVYFLPNGFPQCVAITGQVESSRVKVVQSPSTNRSSHQHAVYWDAAKNSLAEAK